MLTEPKVKHQVLQATYLYLPPISVESTQIRPGWESYLVPDHSPEVIFCLSRRVLSNDKLFVLEVSVEVRSPLGR